MTALGKIIFSCLNPPFCFLQGSKVLWNANCPSWLFVIKAYPLPLTNYFLCICFFIESSGKEEHWCGKCREGGRWGNHKTADHDQWQENFKQMLKERKEQNKGKKKDKSPAKNSSDGPPSPQNLRPALRSSSYFSNFSRHSNI